MKKSATIVLIAILIIISISLVWYLWLSYNNRKAEKENFQKQIGTYILDVDKTFLGTYKKDSALYRNLLITFKEDSTFIMNMKVPFIYDSSGKWIAGGGYPEDWNRLFYKNWNYSKYDKNAGNQFTQPWTDDSIFYINGATPENDAEFIQEIYFKKITSK